MSLALLKKIINKIVVLTEEAVLSLYEYFFILFIFRKKCARLPSSVSGHVNVLTDDHFYKIVFKNQAFFFEEKKHFDLVFKKYSEIGKIIPDYEYLSYLNEKINVMRAQKLCLISDRKENFEAAEKILKIFSEYGEGRNCKIAQFSSLLDGLVLIRKFYGTETHEKVLLYVEQFLAKGQFRVGPCHGDFHYKNIMKQGEDIYIIDLDCFRQDGLQPLDAIYYVNQDAADAVKMPWHTVLIDMIKDGNMYIEHYHFLKNFLDINDLKGYALIYCLDRLAQDGKYLNIWSIFQGDKLRNNLLFLAE